jgi:uncharacterized protein (TIGR02118 family)
MQCLKLVLVGLALALSTTLASAEAKIVVLYGHPKDPAAFDKYYAETHAPMVRKVKAVKRFEIAKPQAAPNGSPPAYYLAVDILFESLEALRATQATDEWKAIAADVPNFASGGATPFGAVVEPKK